MHHHQYILRNITANITEAKLACCKLQQQAVAVRKKIVTYDVFFYSNKLLRPLISKKKKMEVDHTISS